MTVSNKSTGYNQSLVTSAIPSRVLSGSFGFHKIGTALFSTLHIVPERKLKPLKFGYWTSEWTKISRFWIKTFWLGSLWKQTRVKNISWSLQPEDEWRVRIGRQLALVALAHNWNESHKEKQKDFEEISIRLIELAKSLAQHSESMLASQIGKFRMKNFHWKWICSGAREIDSHLTIWVKT